MKQERLWKNKIGKRTLPSVPPLLSWHLFASSGYAWPSIVFQTITSLGMLIRLNTFALVWNILKWLMTYNFAAFEPALWKHFWECLKFRIFSGFQVSKQMPNKNMYFQDYWVQWSMR